MRLKPSLDQIKTTMKIRLRSLLLSATVLLGTLAFAQPLPPYSVTVMGNVAGCTPGGFVNIQTVQNTLPNVNIDMPLNGNCFYAVTLYMDSPVGAFQVSSPCGGAVQTATGNYAVNTFDSLFVVVDLDCGGPNADCLGVPGGPAVPGSPCEDNEPTTTNDIWNSDCQCVGQQITACNACFQVDSTGVPFTISTNNCTTGGVTPYTYLYDFGDGQTSIGEDVVHTYAAGGNYQICMTMADANGCTSTTCDSVLVDADGNINPTYSYDCLGILNGPNTPGTPCSAPALNVPGTWNYACACIPDSLYYNCQAGFWVVQAYANGDTSGTPIPNEVWVWNLSTGNGTPAYTWDFGDGTTSTEAFPTHVYANGGPYELCLTMITGGACTSTFCDSISLDANGILEGMIADGGHHAYTNNIERSGFTLNVLSELPTAINEKETLSSLELWPNPVSDAITLSLQSTHSSRVQVSILDLNGRVVFSISDPVGAGKNLVTVPVEALTNGMYVIRIGDGTNTVSRRFVKQ